MHLVIKIILTLIIIFSVTLIGRKAPTLAGLIAVMPLTGLLAMIWLYMDSRSTSATMQGYAKGAVFGIIPTMLFFIAMWICFTRGTPIKLALLIGFIVWGVAAVVHQLILR